MIIKVVETKEEENNNNKNILSEEAVLMGGEGIKRNGGRRINGWRLKGKL